MSSSNHTRSAASLAAEKFATARHGMLDPPRNDESAELAGNGGFRGQCRTDNQKFIAYHQSAQGAKSVIAEAATSFIADPMPAASNHIQSAVSVPLQQPLLSDCCECSSMPGLLCRVCARFPLFADLIACRDIDARAASKPDTTRIAGQFHGLAARAMTAKRVASHSNTTAGRGGA